MRNPMIAVLRTLGEVVDPIWHTAADVEEALEPDEYDDAAEQRADDDRYQRRFGDD